MDEVLGVGGGVEALVDEVGRFAPADHRGADVEEALQLRHARCAAGQRQGAVVVGLVDLLLRPPRGVGGQVQDMSDGVEPRVGDLVGLGEIARHDLDPLRETLRGQRVGEARQPSGDALAARFRIGRPDDAHPLAVMAPRQRAMKDGAADQPGGTRQ